MPENAFTENAFTAADPHSHGLWETSAPAPVPTPALTGAVRADVAIIGAGYTGLSAALHLARAGKSVALVEAAEPGFGGAGRNVGLVNAGMWVMPEAVVETLGAPWGERLLDALGHGPREVFDLIAQTGIDCQAAPHGTLHCATDAAGLAELRQREAQWQARGADVQLLDRVQAAEKLGTDAYHGALLDRRAGTIQPLAYARGLARVAVAAGAQIYGGSPVGDLHHDGAGWHLTTPQGQVHAKWLIVAGDAYMARVWPEVRREQIHLPYFNFATAPLPDALRDRILPERQGAWDTAEVLTSFRMDAAGRLVWGSVGALRGPGAMVHRAWAERSMAKIFPALRGIGFESAWYGQIGMTTDNLPRLHSFGPNALGVSGYNGRGISPGTVFGRLLAEVITDQRSIEDMPLPLTPVQTPPLRALKEIGYEAGSIAVHMIGARL